MPKPKEHIVQEDEPDMVVTKDEDEKDKDGGEDDDGDEEAPEKPE